MKKNVRRMAWLVAGLMMITVCSCTDKSAPITSGDASGTGYEERSDAPSTAFEDESDAPGTYVEESSDASEEVGSKVGGMFSDSTLGMLFQLTNDVLGKDLATAEEMIGGFFDVELKDRTGSMVTSERKDIVTTIHSYIQILSKDSVRFNGMEIWTDKEDGRVRRIAITCTNSSYTAELIEDTPEFRDEIKKLNADFNDEMKRSMGDPYETGDLVGDEDSIYCYYKVTDDCLANIEIRDFTEPDGNGLLSTSIIFADCDVLLFK